MSSRCSALTNLHHVKIGRKSVWKNGPLFDKFIFRCGLVMTKIGFFLVEEANFHAEENKILWQ